MGKEKINNIRDAVRIAYPEIKITDYSKLPTEGIVDIVKQIENFENNKLEETAEILANLTPKEIEELNKLLGNPSCMEDIYNFLANRSKSKEGSREK